MAANPTVPLCLAAVMAAAWSSPASPDDGPAAPRGEGVFQGVITALRFDVSPPLRSLPPRPIAARTERAQREPSLRGRGASGPHEADGALQSRIGGGEIPTPAQSFDTIINTTGFTPPDPGGDVGPSHYVVMSNVRFAVYSKTGTLLLGPLDNSTLWAGLGGGCETVDAGEPIVLHDQMADRWILTQTTFVGPSHFTCLAVSQTADPTGSYFRWVFPMGANLAVGPKYGVWPDALYFGARVFTPSLQLLGIGAWAANRAQLLAGDPGAQVLSFLVPAANIEGGDGLLPADLDGVVPPPPGSPGYFVGSIDDNIFVGVSDHLTLWKFVADFATPANSSFTLAAGLPSAPFDSAYPCPGSGRRCIPQPGAPVSQFLDVLSNLSAPLHRVAYRNFGTHESLVTSQNVEAGNGPSGPVAGMRWWEIRSPGASPLVFQQGTYAPGLTDGIHRWMGSIAMDRAGNMALGFSVSAPTAVFPGSRYTGRLVTDPPGQMAQGEGVFVNGAGIQTSTTNRWGEYSSMNVDPVDDCTFWYVSPYYAANSPTAWRLRVGSFRFPAPQCLPVPVELQSFEVED